MIEGLIVGAVIFAAGVFTGRRAHKRERPKAKPYGPYCGCGHHLSFHDAKKGCYHPAGFLRDPCSCRQYSGPEPMPDYIAPEIQT